MPEQIKCMDLKYFHKKQKAETNSSFLPIGDTPVQNFMKIRISMNAVRNLWHCDRVNFSLAMSFILWIMTIQRLNIFTINTNIS